VLKSTFNCR